MPSPAFPEVVLETGAIQLRPFQPGDEPATVIACNDEQTQRWLPLPRPYNLENAALWCGRLSRELRENGDGLNLAVAGPEDALIGAVSLKRTDWRSRCTEIGYWTVPQWRCHGHTTAAVLALTRWALDGFMERVELRVASGNTASVRVAEKCGFAREGVLRNAGFTHSGRTDLTLYSMIRSDIGGQG